MAEKKVVLITGVADVWGARLAAGLVGRPDLHIIGLDSEKPEQEIKDLDFIQADIRNPLLSELLETEAVDTLVHLASLTPAHPSEASFDYNVMGTIKVLGACAQARVRKIVLKSTTAVYGALPTNSTFLTEETPLKGSQTWGYSRDWIEIESFCNGFRRQAPELTLTILRFPNIIGPTADTPMTRFLKEPRMPMLLGFDPLMQVIHEEDVTGALIYAVDNDLSGVFNVAAEGNLPLVRLMGLAGKLPLPVFHLFAYWGRDLSSLTGARFSEYFPIELDYLRYPWVGDLNKMRTEMGFTPRYTAEEAVREFAGFQRMRIYQRDSNMEYDINRLRDTIERRKRAAHREVDGRAPEATVHDADSEEEGVLP